MVRPTKNKRCGSPPQVRGKPFAGWKALGYSGITPAGAGKTGFGMRFNYGFEDHPRRCGENRRACGGQQQRVGSPPQVRGKLAVAQQGHRFKGITPAGAGKTL